MKLDEFIQRYDEEPFELIDGNRIPIPLQNARDSRIRGKLGVLIGNFVSEKKQGEVFIKTPFVQKSGKKWVIASYLPDVMFIQKERLEQLAKTDPDWEVNPIPLVPDLVIEIMSPTDRFAALRRKVQRYIKEGVKLAWLVDPERRVIFVFIPNNEQFGAFAEGDKLTCSDIISDLEIDLAKIF